MADEGEEVEERQRGRTCGQVCSLHLIMMIVIIDADDVVQNYRDTDVYSDTLMEVHKP